MLILRLNGAENPERYLAIEPRLDEHGRVMLAVGDRAPASVVDVIILVGVLDRSGRTIDGPVRVTTGGAIIPAQRGLNLRTSLGPFKNAEALRFVKWRVERVQFAQ